MTGRRLRFRGVLGTAIVRVGNVVAGLTGLTEKAARQAEVAFACIHAVGASHAGYYPGAEEIVIKLTYAPADGRLLGAQVVGGDGVGKRLDALATALQAGMTVYDLEQLDLGYAPPFGSATNVVVTAGFVGANALRGTAPPITPRELRGEPAGDNPHTLLDVRTRGEYTAGHLDNVIHVDVRRLRGRLGEVPNDRPLAIYCATGYRSYLAQRILLDHGYRDVRNVLGGLLVLDRMVNKQG